MSKDTSPQELFKQALATTTKAMSTMAVSRPVIPLWSRYNPGNPCCEFILSFLMVGV